MGYVYIMQNKFLPGLFKVGKTDKSPWERASELRSTGVPGTFRPIFTYSVDNALKVEQLAHKLLSNWRVDTKREFFSASLGTIDLHIRRAITRLDEDFWFESFPEEDCFCDPMRFDLFELQFMAKAVEVYRSRFQTSQTTETMFRVDEVPVKFTKNPMEYRTEMRISGLDFRDIELDIGSVFSILRDNILSEWPSEFITYLETKGAELVDQEFSQNPPA